MYWENRSGPDQSYDVTGDKMGILLGTACPKVDPSSDTHQGKSCVHTKWIGP